MLRLGVVSFLNARPLIEPLGEVDGVVLRQDVPSALPGMLRRGQVDAALVPVVDLARAEGAWRRVGDAGIACFGETLTVRVFSRVPPESIHVLHVDTDSHTSVLLAQLIWRRWFEQPIQVRSLPRHEPGREAGGGVEAILLIGDKVVTDRPTGFAHEVDLGTAWKEWMGLPFVFAAWAMPTDRPDHAEAARTLNAARDRGVDEAARIAARCAPAHGWPVDLATRYLTEHMQYRLTERHLEGMARFLEMAQADGLLRSVEELVG